MQPAVGCRGLRQACRKIALPRPGNDRRAVPVEHGDEVVEPVGTVQRLVRARVRAADRTVVGGVGGIVGPAVERADPAPRQAGRDGRAVAGALEHRLDAVDARRA